MRLFHPLRTGLFVLFLTPAVMAIGIDPPDPLTPTMEELTDVERAIITLPLQEAQKEIADFLAEHPDSDHARFGLGVVQFLISGEQLFQAAYRYGFEPDTTVFSMAGPALPQSFLMQNHQPESLTYDQFNAVIAQWVSGVERAEATLAQVNDPEVMLRIKPGLIHMDINRNGQREEPEILWHVFNGLGTRFQASEAGAEQFTIAFDRGDVNWLRGYSHLCMAAGELMLAYDGSEMFHRVGHLMFARPVTDLRFAESDTMQDPWDSDIFLDWIAFVHLTRFPLRDAERPKAALAHFQAAVENAQEMWAHYLAETDDYFEWVPNPNQESVLPGAEVTEEMVSAWKLALDEADALLAGKRLMRFWRNTEGKGVNLRRVFTEPRQFDLILWVQGSDAFPYLEEGEVTTPGTWARLEDAFNYRVFRYGFWLN